MENVGYFFAGWAVLFAFLFAVDYFVYLGYGETFSNENVRLNAIASFIGAVITAGIFYVFNVF